MRQSTITTDLVSIVKVCVPPRDISLEPGQIELLTELTLAPSVKAYGYGKAYGTAVTVRTVLEYHYRTVGLRLWDCAVVQLQATALKSSWLCRIYWLLIPLSLLFRACA